jgi:hypothetical protein
MRFQHHAHQVILPGARARRNAPLVKNAAGVDYSIDDAG